MFGRVQEIAGPASGSRRKAGGVELISKGRHERFVIDKAKFDAKMKEKAEKRAR